MQYERAAIMALTFCIGFTTGLIAYGIPVRDLPVAYVPHLPSHNLAAVAETQIDVSDETISVDKADAQSNNGDVRVAVREKGLFVITPNGEQWVSPSAELYPELKEEAHVALHQPMVRPDGDFVAYCSTLSNRSNTCSVFMFDVKQNGIREVGTEQVTMQINPDTLDMSWTDEGILQVNGLESVSAKTPWLLR